MKLLRYGPAGAEKPGILGADGTVRDLSRVLGDIDGKALAPDSLARLRKLDPRDLPAVSGKPRLGPPVTGIGKIVAIGLNYSDHAAETGAKPPTEPIVFFKSTTSITGPDDVIVIPRGSEKTDWEVELAVVIGRTARYVAVHDALAHVAGYLICNDVSERAYQLERGGTGTRARAATASPRSGRGW